MKKSFFPSFIIEFFESDQKTTKNQSFHEWMNGVLVATNQPTAAIEMQTKMNSNNNYVCAWGVSAVCTL